MGLAQVKGHGDQVPRSNLKAGTGPRNQVRARQLEMKASVSSHGLRQDDFGPGHRAGVIPTRLDFNCYIFRAESRNHGLTESGSQLEGRLALKTKAE